MNMMPKVPGPALHGGTEHVTPKTSHEAAFTLRELLVLLAVLGVNVCLLLPLLAAPKRPSHQIVCQENLYRIGQAIHHYALDHEDRLPGPCWTGVFPAYGSASFETRSGLVTYIAPYLGLPAASISNQYAKVAECPAVAGQLYAPIPVDKVTSFGTNGVSYSCPTLYTNNPGGNLPNSDWFNFPFGRPSTPGELNPVKLSFIKRPATSFALTDLDKTFYNYMFGNTGNSMFYSYYLPTNKVHGLTRNKLFFDGHVEAVQENF